MYPPRMWSVVDVVLILINNNLSLAAAILDVKVCSELVVAVSSEEKPVAP